MSREPNPNAHEWREFAEQVLAANDHQSALHSSDEVARAQKTLTDKFGRVPGFDALYRAFGKEKAETLIERLIEERRDYITGIVTIHSIEVPEGTCHRCQLKNQVALHPFGLVKVSRVSRDWGETVASVALSAVLVPLIGIGRFHGPSKTTSGRVLRLNLQLCKTCEGYSKKMFGGLSDDAYTLHPQWKAAVQAGYTRFVPPKELGNWR